MGNSEILAKHALRACRERGADVGLLRLSDWRLEQCRGCFGCLFTTESCKIADDLERFGQAVRGYDAILVASPTYQLFPPGLVKIVIDRVGSFVQAAQREPVRPLSAALIGVAGIKGWDHFTLPMLNLFLKVVTGYRAEVVDQALFHHPGPGEALLSEPTLRRTEQLAQRLMGEAPAAPPPPAGDEIVCPVCRSNSFILAVGPGRGIQCPFCQVWGEVTCDGVTWDPGSLTGHRFTEAAGQEFVENWILRTRGSFASNLKTILQLKQPYKNTQIDIPWETP